MIKIVLFSFISILIFGALGGGGYYIYRQQHPAADHSIIVVDTTVGKPVPPAFSVIGRVFTVPDMKGVTTTLSLLFPTSRRDYPMGRFTSIDGTVTGHVVAYDDFVSPYFNNRRALPISVSTGATDERFYLAVLEGDDLRHATSVPIGDHIKISTITRQDDVVTVSYFVHDKNQSLDEVPSVGTSAIVNIASGVLVQSGRNPQTEVVVADKFTGKYFWVSTTNADGKIVKPDSLDYFTLEFSGSAITLGTDCNIGGAPLTVGAGSSTLFTVGAIDATKKTCSSQYEGAYFAMFGKVVTYSQQNGGKLTLKFADGGTMQFIAEAAKTAALNPVAATSSASTTKRAEGQGHTN